MKKYFIVFTLFIQSARAQDYSLLQTKIGELNNITTLSDSAQRSTQLDQWWSNMKASGQIPLIAEDSVYFLFRGIAHDVEWMGDFNGWGYNKSFINKGVKIKATDIWLLKTTFPKDARFDYKIVVNKKDWILDPDNPYHQWSGVGGGSPNSELRMPSWKADIFQTTQENIPHGTIRGDILFHSKILGYQITYSVYLPANYSSAMKLPVIYVTDGYEYLHPQMGNMAVVLDNLIAAKKIKPVAAVFVDHREPVNRSNNRRMQELAMNKTYLTFFIDELLPEIERRYPVTHEAKDRAIIGTSMGGLAATYFAFTRPDIFGLVGIQSPAFWTKPQIYSLCSGQSIPEMKVSMTTGLFNDTSEESRKMKAVLEASSCIYHYKEVNEGHSWGNWRSLIDDILIDLFGNP